MAAGTLRVNFIAAWALLLAVKLVLAATLPPFGDEAFYAWEGRHLAWAYSDLPGLTAWLASLGSAFGGGIFAVRLPFLVIGSALPWLVVRIARRWFGAAVAWQAGMLALLMPLSGLMGLLALPDVPMLFATLLCLDAFAALAVRVTPRALAQLALGLCLGAFAHYRFALVVVAGAAGLFCTPAGRALLREPRLWLVLAVGAAAWVPLLAWNLGHAGAGLEFQFVDRHPWQPQWIGLAWPLEQALAVTPLLFALLLATFVACWRRRREAPAWSLLLGIAGVSVFGYFLLAFFADSERVSFHWPLPGWLALACAAPVLLAQWRPLARRAVLAVAVVGLSGTVAYLGLVASPAGRLALAAGPAYADNFSGWSEVAGAARAALADMPEETRLVADNFMLGAQLSLARGGVDVPVLDHPLNAKHGRAVQLADWGLLSKGREDWGAAPVLLAVEDTARPLKQRLEGYRSLCARAGGLPVPEVLNVDRGRKRFLLFRFQGDPPPCVAPALAWIESPSPGARASGQLEVSGWALKEGAGIARIDITLDGAPVVQVRPTVARPDVRDYWRSPGDPRVGFRARLDLAGRSAGTVWLGLVLHGTDGSVEAWPAQPLRID